MVKFTAEGNYLSSFGNGQRIVPVGICIGSNDTVFVRDCRHNRVSMFTSEGDFLHHCAELKRGSFPDVFSIVSMFNPLSGLAVDEAGYLFVCDVNHDSVKVY